MERKNMPARPGRLAGSPARTGRPFRAKQGLVRAAEASGRGDTDICLSRTSAYTQSVRDEILPHLLHWKADICCYSLEGVRWGMRGSVDGITLMQIGGCEADP